MKRLQLLASIVAAASLAVPSLAFAAELGASAQAAKPAAKLPATAKDGKAAPSKAAPADTKAAPQPKESKPVAAKAATPTEAPTDASPLMGAFQSSDEFLVTVVKSADGNPAKDVLITISPVTDPKNPRFCQFFGDATLTSSTQTKVRVTQYQPRNVSASLPACSVTLEASKDQLRLTGHSVECESLCMGVPDAYAPKQPIVRLKD